MILSYQKRILLTAIIMLTALILVMAALWFPLVKRDVKIMDAIFVLDITDSMNVKDAEIDGKKVSRLAWAKEFTRRTLLEMPCGAHAGLAIFSEARSLILMNPVEVCSSYHDLTQMLEQVDPYMAWARSSEVSKAVYTAIRQAKQIEPKPTIVMLTDGHESPPINPTLFPKFAGTPGEIHGILVGVGGDELLPIPKTNDKGVIDGVWGVNEVMHEDVYASMRSDKDVQVNRPRTEHLSSQKKSHLSTLANRVGFAFVSSPNDPVDLVDTIRDESNTREQTIDYDLYAWFSGAALILILLVFLPYRWFVRTDD
ncbi:MAG TPA: VWA domain-containing protein [Methylophaga aminisulfidivorans]|uniref:VWA domain-containing protein n=1 Tax=Methylophaga TaxID=40222 RepID=UPI001772D133|nr:MULTISPECIES: VWA domain-containing protein [Methylophaga]HIC46016.1 VWA domain-containing protein [Methylophaga sp.]HIM40508.1 VWA domain-containing protein [Methylophaga aminisulfidivorans]